MNEFFLLISILVFASTKDIPEIKTGVNTTFDYQNQNFIYKYSGPGKDAILFYIKYENSIEYKIECLNDDTKRSSEGPDEDVHLFEQYDKSGSCTMKFTPLEGEKGSIVIYTFKTELKIKLKNKYGNINLPTYAEGLVEYNMLDISQLTYSVPNLDRDVTAKFEFNDEIEIHGEIYTIDNPFKVCHGKDCTENISTYDFKKGESYVITVNVKKVIKDNEILYLVPGFSFYDIKYNGKYSPDDIIINYFKSLKINYIILSLFLLLL